MSAARPDDRLHRHRQHGLADGGNLVQGRLRRHGLRRPRRDAATVRRSEVGGKRRRDPKALGEASDFVVTMLPTSKHVAAGAAGADGVASAPAARHAWSST